MRVLLIHNPGAGDEEHEHDDLVRALAGAGHDVEYRAATGRLALDARFTTGSVLYADGGYTAR